ncbi:MAG: SUMF1/EgtB/PvdO family nonheme iron enzyme [Thermoguttaceae bacterium]
MAVLDREDKLMFGKALVRGLVAATVLASAITAQAVTIDLVPVGNPGNAAYHGNSVGDLGAVAYGYKIGTYEVTNAQYCEFLNAKLPNIADLDTGSLLPSDIHGLYDPRMETQVYGGINYDPNSTAGAKFSPKPGFANRPVNYVRPCDALRFINWLQNGQGNGDTETGTFTMLRGGPNSGTSTIVATATRAQWAAGTTLHWVLPSIDEWFKAAYHKNDGVTGNYWLYPTRSNSPPGRDMNEATNPGNNANYYSGNGPIDSKGYYTTVVGEFEQSQSPYGTFDQAGNVLEWHEWSTKGLQMGCSFDWPVSYMTASSNFWLASDAEQKCVGFRVGLLGVPEPSSIALLLAAVASLLAYTWRRRRQAA